MGATEGEAQVTSSDRKEAMTLVRMASGTELRCQTTYEAMRNALASMSAQSRFLEIDREDGTPVLLNVANVDFIRDEYAEPPPPPPPLENEA